MLKITSNIIILILLIIFLILCYTNSSNYCQLNNFYVGGTEESPAEDKEKEEKTHADQVSFHHNLDGHNTIYFTNPLTDNSSTNHLIGMIKHRQHGGDRNNDVIVYDDLDDDGVPKLTIINANPKEDLMKQYYRALEVFTKNLRKMEFENIIKKKDGKTHY
tara:strand:+ start:267 stop:749 length:483 start_codon:yes stop_codon:yes gene_type:complete